MKPGVVDNPSPTIGRRLLMGSLIALLAVITFLAAAPLLGVIFVGVVAGALHCRVDEGSVHPCLYQGHDYGPLLYGLGVAGWLMLFTLPVLGLTLLAWLAIAIAVWARRAARGSAARG